MKHQITVLLLLCITSEIQAQDQWPGFLGPDASKVTAESIPTAWSPQENMAWKSDIPGYGQSSPVIWNNQVYVTSVEGPNKEKLHIVCYDIRTGKQLWIHTQPSTYPEKNTVYISRAAPTPVLDENGVYAYFESGDVVAVSHDGKFQWTASLTERYGAPINKFGLSASPVQTKEGVIILIDDEGPSYLTALSKSDGKELWKTDRKSRVSWSSPMLVPVGKTSQVVCSSAGSLEGYDPATGKRLWSFGQVGGNNKTSPLPVGNGSFLVGASPGRSGENEQLAKQSNGLFKVRQEGDKWQNEFVWTDSSPVPSWATPIAYQGYAYWVNRAGVVYCLDLKTGKPAYTNRIQESCWATPVGLGDHIYFFGKNGATTVLKAGAEFEVVTENKLWTEEAPPVNNVPQAKETGQRQRSAAMFSRPTLYGAALVNEYLILRTGSQLFCIHTKK
ncbi:outer membrane protein assembly factor BamB family protein [Gimesia fumaroli]|uniref:Outer membrane biogenesis protein BamB n=1 Tax=Gimesia fumaroli TaxID=2527976 RepID=A0A518IEN4_9PLAN|nr:PQQ-binding-like beta-propeller repeat protein [Gimesia fumaroli]QDV51553.1 outer membrane biogenesis protein BamB [Gimesia fumaroli]